MSKQQHPQKGPTKIDVKALQELATKAGFDLVPAGRQKTFLVAQAMDPNRADRVDYRDAIFRSFVRQAADWIQQEVMLEFTDETLPSGARTAMGRIVVVMPPPKEPTGPAADGEDVL